MGTKSISNLRTRKKQQKGSPYLNWVVAWHFSSTAGKRDKVAFFFSFLFSDYFLPLSFTYMARSINRALLRLWYFRGDGVLWLLWCLSLKLFRSEEELFQLFLQAVQNGVRSRVADFVGTANQIESKRKIKEKQGRGEKKREKKRKKSLGFTLFWLS